MFLEEQHDAVFTQDYLSLFLVPKRQKARQAVLAHCPEVFLDPATEPKIAAELPLFESCPGSSTRKIFFAIEGLGNFLY